MYGEKEFLSLSGIQHFSFCRRQWALIHIDQQWCDNVLTSLGEVMHERAHDEAFREKRGDSITVRGLTIHSRSLGLSGKCDVVEFRMDESGIPIMGEAGLWLPCPVEYKRGRKKLGDADRLQLCAQAICLEEMLACEITTGYLFYGSTKSRELVELDATLRAKTQAASDEMHELYRRGHIPNAKWTKSCKSCSLFELCLPKAGSAKSERSFLGRCAWGTAGQCLASQRAVSSFAR